MSSSRPAAHFADLPAERVSTLASHLAQPARLPAPARAPAHPDDVVIVSAVRTPITRARKGMLKDAFAEQMLAAALAGCLERSGLSRDRVHLVQDIQVGTVLPPGGGATAARQAALYAGFPVSTSVATCNRQCASGLQAVANIAAAIRSGFIDIGIGAGVESMTMHYGPGAMQEFWEGGFDSCPQAEDTTLPMGDTSENVARDFNVSRQEQDRFALASHQRAAAAQAAGLFRQEIVPVIFQDASGQKVTVSQDDGIRGDTTAAALAALRPAFAEDGTTTAGNSSQVSDGAAAVMLARRRVAIKIGLPILARFIAFRTVGVEPRIMGIGPVAAIPAVLKQAGLNKDDIDIYEINEAFASQACYTVRELRLNPDKVNPLGGAIALGHPLGCTGARQIATLLPQLQARRLRFGCTSMCVGTGMGAAAVIENELL
ncbi:hypothetical protein H696_04601 [Fonticula alba]|uniref:Acetyl-CoA acyltransferase n=1 Tax=Fonticula alba TaxID=691883 RepID=A0A058Z4X8_FONAL|nr:hypothetical protein H696_04601 [Fonticula alba]KCV69191.1 hypothetical protein H696_04601 [Fonticula alba]|eukprot:XP_009496762.1 hypothetical protein H696_04601 [Fonticula alba]